VSTKENVCILSTVSIAINPSPWQLGVPFMIKLAPSMVYRMVHKNVNGVTSFSDH
jgi:hypothetical protein